MANTTKSSCMRIVAAALVAASVAGCTTGSAQSSPPTAPGSTSLIKVTLGFQPSGAAAVSWDRQTANITAKLQIGGFTPGSTYALDIQKGNCAAPGEVAVPFPKVTADSGGAITTTVTSERPSPGGLLPATALSIHPDSPPPSPTEPAPAPLACADITAAFLTTTLNMGPVGQRPQGWANVTYNSGNKTLIVATAASGLAPGTAHTQYIGLGTCAAQGAVKYPMTDVVASPNGTAYQTTVVENVDQAPPSSGGWYLDVGVGPSAPLQDGQPAPYVAPTLCGDIGVTASAS